jgi:uncharacterized delta-60 repeat protein
VSSAIIAEAAAVRHTGRTTLIRFLLLVLAAALLVAAPATSTDRGAPINPSAASIDLGNALVVQRDGSVVLAGLSRRYRRWDFALARYRPNGRLDPSFGTGGLVLTAVARRGVGALGVAEAPGRKVVAVGGAYAAENLSGFALVRYTSRGRPDPTFAGDGTVLTTFARPRRGQRAHALARDVVVQPDGRVIVTGSSSTGTALARYVVRGVLDRSFGAGGQASSAPRSDLTAVALQRDGKIVVAGLAEVPAPDRHFFVARFTSRGRVDGAFGSGGSAVTTLGLSSVATDVAIQPDGRIVLAGFVSATGGVISRQLGVVRLLQNGRIDTSFGTNGTVLTNFAVDSDPALALQSDGKIVVACGLRSPPRFGIARYLPDGSLDPTFGEGGKVRTHFTDRSVARDVALTRDGKILVAGSVGGDFALARFNRDGSLDTSFGTDGLARTPLGWAWWDKEGR